MLFGPQLSNMPNGSALTISRRMISVVPVPASAMAQEANSSKFSFFSVTRPCKRRNSTSDAGRISKKRSMTDSKSRSARRRDNPVYQAALVITLVSS